MLEAGGIVGFLAILRHFGACSSVCGLALGRGSSCSCLVPVSSVKRGEKWSGELPTSRKLNFVQLEFVSPVEERVGGWGLRVDYTASTSSN